jgi:hypothetical protein
MQSGLVNAGSKVGNVSKKAWFDINTLWGNSSYDSIGGANESTNINNSNISQSSSSGRLKQENDWDWNDSNWDSKPDDKRGNTSKNNLANFDNSASDWSTKEDDLWETIESKKH